MFRPGNCTELSGNLSRSLEPLLRCRASILQPRLFSPGCHSRSRIVCSHPNNCRIRVKKKKKIRDDNARSKNFQNAHRMLRASWIVDLEFFRAARVGQFATFRAVRARLSGIARYRRSFPLSLFLSSKSLVKPNSLLSHYVYAPLSPPFILPVSFSLSFSFSLCLCLFLSRLLF